MKKFFKIGCLGLLGFFVLVLLIGIIFGEEQSSVDSEPNQPVDSPTVEQEVDDQNEESVEVQPVGIGENLQVGDVVFKVNEVSSTTEIKEADGYITYKPEAEGAVFYIVNVTVENIGNEAITTDSSFFKLVQGEREYSPSTIFSTDSKFFLYDGINPGLAKSGNVLFEVPDGNHEYILNVQTGFWGTEQGQIKLY